MDLGQSFVFIRAINPFIALLSEIFAASSMRVSSFDSKKRSGNSEETGKQEEAEQTNEVDDPIDARSAFHTDDVLGNNLPKGSEDWVKDAWDEWSDWDESTDEVPHEIGRGEAREARLGNIPKELMILVILEHEESVVRQPSTFDVIPFEKNLMKISLEGN